MSADNRHIGQRAVDEDRLDSLIDTVARQMTEFEPSGALRARVLEQVQKRRRQSSPTFPRWAWAGTAAAAAVVLAVAAAVWVVSPQRTRDDGLSTVAELRPGVPSSAAAGADRPLTEPAAPPEAVLPAGRLAAIARASRPAAARGGPAAEADDVQNRHPVPALAEIEPLMFSAVGPDPLQIAAMEVAPLTAMPPIDIPGLDPDSRDIQSADPKKEK